MKAWLVVGSCGDYKCEGVHPLAVATTEKRAETLATEAREQVDTHVYEDGRIDRLDRWYYVKVCRREADQLLPEVRGRKLDQRSWMARIRAAWPR